MQHTNRDQILKRTVGAFCCVLVAMLSASAQPTGSELQQAKANLENLQRSLIGLNRKQQVEIERLTKEIENKGEFETSKQFEKRKQVTEETIEDLERQISRSDGPEQNRIYEQMHEILRADYATDLNLTLGRYDADAGRFVIFTNQGVELGHLAIPLAEAPALKAAFASVRAVGKVGLLLDAENKAREYLITGEIVYGGKSYPLLPPPFTKARAMEIVFGNYRHTEKGMTSSWRSSYPWPNERFVMEEARVALFEPFRECGVEKYLLLTESNYGKPSIAVFEKSMGGWRLLLAVKDGGEQSFGLTTYRLIQLGPDKYALRFFTEDDDGTAEEKYWRLDGKFPREILRLSVSQDYEQDDAPEDRISFTSKVKVLPNSTSGFFDIQVTSSGKKARLVGKKWVMTPFSKNELYVYSDGQYQPTALVQR